MRFVDRFLQRASDIPIEEFATLINGGVTNTTSGVVVGPRQALGISAWYSGVRYISETIAGLPCPTYRDNPAGRIEIPDRSWKRKPAPETPWFGLIEFLLMSLLHKGNAYCFKQRNETGQVVWLIPVHPDRVKVGQTPQGFKLFTIDNHRDLPFTTREILHIPGLSYDGIVGINPLVYQANTLGAVAASSESAARSFGQGSVLDAYLSVPDTLDDDAVMRLKAIWDRQHKGLMNAHELAILAGGAEYKTIGLNPEQTQLLESRKFGVTEVARVLRLPPHKLYDLERATYSNIEHQSIEAVTDGILPWCNRIEAWVNSDPDLTGPKTFHEFNIDGLLRGDFKTRMDGYVAAINAGVFEPAEARHKENLPYVEGSEYLLRPMNMVTVGPDAVEDPDAP